MMVVAKQSSRHNMWTEITRRKYQREGQRYASDLAEALLFCVFSLPVREPLFVVFEQLRQCDRKRDKGFV